MKKVALTFISFLICLGTSAQVQNGYVRTVGRPNNKAGVRLPNVIIRVNGLHNPVVSSANGSFGINLGGGKTSYSFSAIRLDGYELQEKELLGRAEPVSTIVPKEIVMVSLKERQAIEDSVRVHIERRYEAKLIALQQELNTKKITEELYRKELQELEDNYEKRDQMVNDMVERYSHTDYAKLSDIEAQINSFIETGELEKADSLINTMNICKLEQEREHLSEDIRLKEFQIGKERLAKGSIDSMLAIAYNGKYEVFAADFQNDSAALYLEKLANLDTTNVFRLLAAASYISEYVGDYEKSMSYVNCAIRNAEKQNSPYLVSAYNNCGLIHRHLGNNSAAIDYCTKALQIYKIYIKEDDCAVALILDNIGGIYLMADDLVNALLYFERGLSIRLQLLGDNNPDVASSYNNIGSAYRSKGDYVTALEYFGKALKIIEQQPNQDLRNAGSIYGNISLIYSDRDEYEKAIEYSKKSLEIKLKIYQINHPDCAEAYNNLAMLYKKSNKYDKAEEYMQEAIRIQMLTLGENHPKTGLFYSNMGTILSDKGDMKSASEYYIKAISLQMSFQDGKSKDLATTFENIGLWFYKAKEYDKALEFYEKALDILNTYDDCQNDKAECYAYMALAYMEQGKENEAMKNGELAIGMEISAFGPGHPRLISIYHCISLIYSHFGSHSKAAELSEKALKIQLTMFGEQHQTIFTSHYALAAVYLNGKNFPKAYEHFSEALEIGLRIHGEESDDVALCYSGKAAIDLNNQNYQVAVEGFKKALAVLKHIHGEQNQEVIDCYQYLGSAFFMEGDKENAATCFKKELSLIKGLYGETDYRVKQVEQLIAISSK